MNNYQTILKYLRDTLTKKCHIWCRETKKQLISELLFWCSPRGSNPGPQH